MIKYLIALLAGVFFSVCGFAGVLLGLLLRAANRGFDTAVVTVTVFYVLKYLRVW